MADPREYTFDEKQAIVDHVCTELANKRTQTKVLREDEGMPVPSTFFAWLASSEVWQSQVARAREAGIEAHIEDMIDIADNATDDVYIDEQGKPRLDGVSTQRAKVMIYAREKAAQLLAPRRFGQKLDVTSDGKALPAPQVNTLVVASDKVDSLIALAASRKAEALRLLDD